jgi:putative SOS response-associated peptidase YedK
MCGRYTTPAESEAERYFLVHLPHWQFSARYNVAPSQPVPAVRLRGGEREGVLLRWGLIPSFARGVPGGYSMINARVETVTSSPAYRGPWKRAQRCILPATGFYEWHVNPDGSKRPFFIHANDQPVFGFAGLWDVSTRADGVSIESCTIITLPANALLAEIHNAPGKQRMPAMLSAAAHATWLAGTPEEALAALQPYPADCLVAWPVSTRVNSPRHDDASLILAQ